MEAIMKAFERMEKAEQRKLENRDKQSKRRESDPQQSCSVTSTSESKELSLDHGEDHFQQSMLKGRRRSVHFICIYHQQTKISKKSIINHFLNSICIMKYVCWYVI